MLWALLIVNSMNPDNLVAGIVGHYYTEAECKVEVAQLYKTHGDSKVLFLCINLED